MVRIISLTVVALFLSHLQSTELTTPVQSTPPPTPRPKVKLVGSFQSCAPQYNTLLFCSKRDHDCNPFTFKCTKRTDLTFAPAEMEQVTGPYEPCANESSSIQPSSCLFGFSCFCDPKFGCNCLAADAADSTICDRYKACNEYEYCAYGYDSDGVYGYGCASKWYNSSGGPYQSCYANKTCDGDLECVPLNRYYSLCA